MKKLTLKKLTRTNFQEQREVIFNFAPEGNTISGDNRTGKTKTYNSFLWLMYGKNEDWATNFDICPLDKENNKIPYLNTVVEGIFDADGTELELKREVDRKWDKDKESGNTILKSEPVKYFVNKAPVKKTDYEKRISDMMPEETFKLLTTHDYFAKLHWEKRRKMILDLAGGIDPVIEDKKFADLFTYLNEKKMSLENYKSTLAFEKKGIEKKLIEIPIRVDELTGQIKEITGKPDKDEIEDAKRQIKEVEASINDSAEREASNNKKIIKLEGDKFSKEQEIQQLKNNAVANQNANTNDTRNLITYKKVELRAVDAVIRELTNNIRDNKAIIKSISENLETLKGDYTLIRSAAKEAPDTCFNCHQKLPAEMLDKQKEKVAGELKNILEKGNKKNAERENRAKEITEWEADIKAKEKIRAETIMAIQSIEEQLSQILPAMVPEKELQALEASVADIEGQIAKVKAKKGSIEHLLIAKRNLNQVFDRLHDAEKDENYNLETQKKIDNHKKEIAKNRELLADIEKREHIFEEYERRRYTAIEAEINKMFTYVSFKMYEQLKNGEWSPKCKILVNGVDYHTSLNTEGKINAGLSIIKFIHGRISKYAPVFIDNAESVSKFVPLDTQVIKLKKVTGQKLKIT